MAGERRARERDESGESRRRSALKAIMKDRKEEEREDISVLCVIDFS